MILHRMRKQDVVRAEFRLKASYPESRLGNPANPLDDLIYIILSGQTNESRFQCSFAALKQAFPSWNDALSAPASRIESIIRNAGLARQKSRYIRGILRTLRDDFGRPTLAPLKRMSTREAEAYLSRLPGVGIKTARCILMYTLHREVFPADVHCLRVMERLGWICREGKRAELFADRAQRIVPASLRRDLHIRMVQHGRDRCTPRTPSCCGCCLNDICTYAGSRKATRPTVVDLCCGPGGFSWGFLQGGFDVLLGVDRHRYPLDSYAENIAGAKTLQADVCGRDALDKVTEVLGDKAPTVVIAGPPCQGFSRAGRRLAEDPRNLVLRACVKLAVDLDPDVIVIENVMNMQGERFSHHVRNALGVLRRNGFRFAQAVLRATAFGVPQLRTRIVIVASQAHARGDILRVVDRLTDRTDVPDLSVSAAFSGLPADPSRNGHFSNHEAMKHSKRVVAKIRRIKPGEGPLSYRKLRPDTPARTLICGHRALPCHYAVPRTITVREGARIQGFPDEYRFQGTKSSQMQQVVDAVPPRLALGIANAVRHLATQRVIGPKSLVEQVLRRSTFSPPV